MNQNIEQIENNIHFANNQLAPAQNALSSDQLSLRNLSLEFYSHNREQATRGTDLYSVDLITDVGDYSDVTLLRAYNTSIETFSEREAFLAPLRVADSCVSAGTPYFISCNGLVTSLLNKLPRENLVEVRAILLRITESDPVACYQLMNILVYGAPIVNFDSFQNIAAVLLTRVPEDIPATLKPFYQGNNNSFNWIYGILPDSIKSAIQHTVVNTIQCNPAATTAVCVLFVSGSVATFGLITPFALLSQSTKFIINTLAETPSTPHSNPNTLANGSVIWHLQEIANHVIKFFSTN
jgi:hypothetical protein